MHCFSISEANPPKDATIVEYMVVLAHLAADGSLLGDVRLFVWVLSSFVSGFLSKGLIVLTCM